MIALGWTMPGAAPPHPLRTVAAAGCAAVVVEAALATAPQDRVRLQVLCARGLPAFLPLAVRERTDLREALDHAAREGPVIAARLAAVSGLVQITLRAERRERTAPVAHGPGWLRARAARRAEDEARRAAVAVDLRAVLARWTGAPALVGLAGAGVQAHALVAADVAATALCALAEALSSRPALRGFRIAVTGPWPVSAFVAPTEEMR
jgi:hypothetical protein